MTVAELSQRLDGSELAEWIVYDSIQAKAERDVSEAQRLRAQTQGLLRRG